MAATQHDGMHATRVLVFCAPWCAQCLPQQRAFGAVREALEGAADCVWVDIDAHPDSVRQYAIDAIPMTVVVRDGIEWVRLVGLHSTAAILASVHATENCSDTTHRACDCGRPSRAAANH